MFTTRSHFRNRWERMGSQWCDFYHLLPGIRRVLWTQHTPKLVPQIKGFRVQHTLNRFYMDICGICANIVHIFSGLHLGMCSNLVRPCHAVPGKELWTLAVWGTLAWWTLEGDARWFRTLLHWSCFVWENYTFVGKLMQVYVSPHPLLAMGAIWKSSLVIVLGQGYIRRVWDQCRADGKPIMEESAKKAPSDHEDGSAWASLGIGRDELMAGIHRLMGSVWWWGYLPGKSLTAVTYLYWGSDYQPITSAVYYWQLVKHDVADANPCRCFVDDSRLCSHLCQHATTNGWLDHYGNCSLTIPHTIKANYAR